MCIITCGTIGRVAGCITAFTTAAIPTPSRPRQRRPQCRRLHLVQPRRPGHCQARRPEAVGATKPR